MMFFAFVLTAILAYLIGSINFSIIFSRALDSDIRTKGSGNAGSTNMLRNYGVKAGVLTLLAEFFKAIVATFTAKLVFMNIYPEFALSATAVAGLFCSLGHCFPVFFKFKGGKGVAVSAMAILMIDWRSFLFVIAAFLIQVIIFKYVSLGSITGAVAFPTSLAFFTDFATTNGVITFILSILMAMIVIVLHAPNIKRLIKGTESKLKFKK